MEGDHTAPFTAYRGDGDYVFASYAHADQEHVYPLLQKLRGDGVNFWYDEGITPTARWTDELATAIDNCSVFLAFVTPAYVASENCLNELQFAVSRRSKTLTVFLDETDLPPGLELSLGGKQAIHKAKLAAEDFESKVRDTLNALIAGELESRVPPGVLPKASRRWPAVVIALAVLAGLIFGITRLEDGGGETDTQVAVGVLPFATIGTDSSQQYLGESLAEDLSMRLGSWRSIPVVAHASMIREDLPTDISEAAHELNARYLVRGNARIEGDRLSVVAELINGETEATVWSERFEEPMKNVFDLQEQLGQAIVAQLNPALLQAESERAARKDPSTLSAWEAAFRGWWHVNRDTREDMTESRRWFQTAIERDPNWGWPHATTALSHYRELANGWSSSPESATKAMYTAAERAMSLDPSDPFSHHAMGHAYQRAGRLDEALAAFARGVELTPYDAMANACYAMQLAASNQPARAIEVVQHAMAISPKDPWSHWFALVMSRAHYAAGEYSAARQWADRSLQLKPNPGAMFHSIAATAMLGEVDVARERVAALRVNRPLPPISVLRQGFAVTTESDYVARLMEGLELAGFDA